MFCQRMPKVELHAHLHGSMRFSTLKQLLRVKCGCGCLPSGMVDISDRLVQSVAAPSSCLADCFSLFAAIHCAVQDVFSLQRVCREALVDFERDQVRYLELRTTPRDLRDGTTKRGSVYAILEVFRDFEATAPARQHRHCRCRRDSSDEPVPASLRPRLLLSIDRSASVAEAEFTVDLAIELSSQGRPGHGLVVGVDLSGNPTKGAAEAFLPALRRARQHGLKLSIHCGEVCNDQDTTAILELAPERVGHALMLNTQHLQTIFSNGIVIECCPSSNAVTLGLSQLEDHPTLDEWLRTGHAFSICTDDTCVFSTSLTAELVAFAEAYALTADDLAALTCRTTQFIFEDEETKRKLRQSFDRECRKLLGQRPAAV